MLRHCLPPSVRQALRALPQSLDEAYESMLKKIAEAKRPQAHCLLQCVIAAIRPLHVEELAEILALNFDTAQDGVPKLNERWRLRDDPELTVLSMCPSLIDIVDDHSSNSRVVKFAHSSVAEFLASERITILDGGISRFHITLESAHTLIAQACLGILLQLGNDEPARSYSPLAAYAARHWVYHAQFEDVAFHIKDGMQRLFDPHKLYFTAWLRLHDVDDGWNLFGGHGLAKHRGTPLYYASLCGFRDLAAHLISRRPQDVNTRGGLNHSPLVAALHKRNFYVAELLYKHGADLDVRGLDQQTPLHAASLGGHADIIEWLLAHGADPNSRDGLSESTPLHWAAADGQLEVVRMLLGRGAKANVMDKEYHTPLHLASNFGYLEIVRLLLENGANVDAEDVGRWKSLHTTLFGGDNTQIPILSDVFNTWNDGHLTPLHLASSGGHIETVRLLIEHAADVNAQDERNSTPLHFASSKGQTETVQLLIDRGSDVHARDESHSTPLHLASSTGSIEAVRILISHGADIDAEDDDGQTPYQVAQSGRHPHHGLVAQLLSNHSSK
jgi:ankyrin repeat protein